MVALRTVVLVFVEVAAATEKGIPVTNCPDTFIEEVADHAMMLLLATHRRAIEQDRMVREGRWTEGRPQLLQVPRLMGQPMGFIAFGRIAGAGLDVLQVEPAKPDNPLLKMPHVILSPHNASASARFDPGRRRRVGQELALVLSGRWPMSCVNPTVLPSSGLRRWQPVSME